MSPTKHSNLEASSAHRWLACPRRTVDPRPFSALALVGIASLYVAALIVAGRV